MTRRDFLKGAVGAALTAPILQGCRWQQGETRPTEEETGMAAQTVLPRWRGFNVHNMFHTGGYEPFREEDFLWISDWGFDFARINVCYTLVVHDRDPHKPNEQALEEVDRGIELARKHKLHACLDMHVAPGYAYHESEYQEPYNLWKDEEAQEAFCFLWQMYAKRYRGIPPSDLSFNLINEPATEIGKMTREEHERVIRRSTAAIREISPDRLIIADGLEWGDEPLPELTDLGIAQSGRFYTPFHLTHYRAEWEGAEAQTWPEPVWPGLVEGGKTWNRETLKEHYRPWAELAKQGVGVVCGEGGAYKKTPHPVVLGWLRDVMEVLKAYNIGYSVWNFRGPFGILDSGRADVEYENFHGHKLDRKMLALLQQS